MRINWIDIAQIAQIDRAWNIETATIFASLAHYHEADIASTQKLGLSCRIGTGYDRLIGGSLQLAMQLSAVVSKAVDWERWDWGVFSYEHLEHGPSRADFPAFVMNKLSDEDWYLIAEQYEVPDEEAVLGWLKAYAAQQTPAIPLTTAATNV